MCTEVNFIFYHLCNVHAVVWQHSEDVLYMMYLVDVGTTHGIKQMTINL